MTGVQTCALPICGRLYFEINQEYGRETVDMLAGLEYKNIELRKDLFQNDRMIKAEK